MLRGIGRCRAKLSGPPRVATPTFSPVAGEYGPTQNVTISCSTGGASIYYTTDGSTPTAGSTLYSTPVAVAATTTLKAIAIDGVILDSNIGTATYTINGTVATPSISPTAGTYNDDQTVTITCATSGASIYYTTDGSTPDSGDTLYSGGFSLGASATVKAIAIKTGYTDSAVASNAITLKVATPTFSPVAGSYGSTQSVAISTTTAGDTIRYTVDGSTPDGSSTVYSGAISVATTQTVKAIGIKAGYTNSDVGSAAYTIGASYITATGGTITTDGDYKVHTFTSSGDFEITSGSGDVEYVILAGGGGGGRAIGGGGGAGGYKTGTSAAMSAGTYAAVIGGGGAGGTSNGVPGSSGSNSSWNSITCDGGGGGGGFTANGANGGSGGGGSGYSTAKTGGTGIGGQGYEGGDTDGGAAGAGAGGGGSSAAAADVVASVNGTNGGAGTSSSISGAALLYGAGGGGGSDGYTGGNGGSSIGGNGGSNSVGADATVNRGSGGGGGGYAGTLWDGGAGSSGVVILRYQFQ